MKINKPQTSDSSSKSLHQLYTQWILNTLKEWEPVKIEWENSSFDFYKKWKNSFWVSSNSMWVTFVNNPMPTHEMQEILHPLISTAANFEDKLPHDLLLRLRDIFFQKKWNEKIWDTFNGEVLFQNTSLDSIISQLYFQQELLKETESMIQKWLVLYLEEATKNLDAQIKSFPEHSVIRKKLEDKFNYLENYRKLFSQSDFTQKIEQKIHDLESFLDILSSDEDGNHIQQEIVRTKNIQKTF